MATTEEVQFKNRDGLVITTSNPETINNYRLDDRFKEVTEEEAHDYQSMRKAELEAEVARRNADRPEDEQIVVEGKGTVADLVAALEGDDQS